MSLTATHPLQMPCPTLFRPVFLSLTFWQLGLLLPMTLCPPSVSVMGANLPHIESSFFVTLDHASGHKCLINTSSLRWLCIIPITSTDRSTPSLHKVPHFLQVASGSRITVYSVYGSTSVPFFCWTEVLCSPAACGCPAPSSWHGLPPASLPPC